MSRFTDRLERDLREIASRAEPSPGAWEAIAARLEENAEPEVTPLPLAGDRRRPRPLKAVAAVAAAAVIAAAIAVGAGRDEVVRTADLPPVPTTECPDGSLPSRPSATSRFTQLERPTTQGAPVNKKLGVRLISATTAIALVGACSDDAGDETRVLARGDVEFVGSDGLGERSMDIDVEETDGEVTGTADFGDVKIRMECADTETEDLVIVAGEVTSPSEDGTPAVGELLAIIIREGDPDSVTVWEDRGESDSCEGLLESLPDDVADDDGAFTDVESGDLETG